MLKLVFILIVGIALVQARPSKRTHGSGSQGSGSHGSGSQGSGSQGSGSQGSGSQGSGSQGSGSYESYETSTIFYGPMTANDLKEELAALQSSALEMAGLINDVNGLAVDALNDHTGEGWEDFGHAMEHTFHEVGHRFGEETDRMVTIADVLWHGYHHLEQDVQCGNVAALDDVKEDTPDLEMQLAVAMIADLGCMAEQFATAEDIPVDDISDDMHENDAIEIVHNILGQMHQIKKSGDLFGHSIENIVHYMDGSADSHDDDDDDDNTSDSLDTDKREGWKEEENPEPTQLPE